MFAVKHIVDDGSETLLEAKSVNYYPVGGSGRVDYDDEAHVIANLSDGNGYIASYGDVFVMQGGKTVQRYPLGSAKDWLEGREKKNSRRFPKNEEPAAPVGE